ncbi:MAG TPA: RNA methyltransferase [Rhabdochlamydiaceae bacterium]|nr:RNA methyltransferase [Rhabdochlamydiaceae bacterium]
MLTHLLSSAQNPKIKTIAKLKERRQRDETGQFLIEGYRELKRAAQSGVEIQMLLICPKLFLGENEETLIQQIDKNKAEIFECPPHLFEKLSYRDRPDGLIAIARQMQFSFDKLQSKKEPFVLIAEGIEKPGNLGSILRSADASGADGVIVCDRCTDIYNPNVVRASVGTLFTLPVIEASSEETLLWLQKKQIKVTAATPSAHIEFTEANFKGPIAVVVGTEQLGLTDFWMKAADIRVRIPMKGAADSLNVAAATTLLLYEVLRQRNLSR